MKTSSRAKTALLVEDNLLIALDAEGVLLSLGFSNVRTAEEVESALHFIEYEALSVALVDIDIGKQSGFVVAERLTSAGIPFVFASSSDGVDVVLPEAYRAVPVITKPFGRDTLETLAALAGQAADPES